MRESSPESDTLSPSTLSEIQKWAAIILPILVTLLSRLAAARNGSGRARSNLESDAICGPDNHSPKDTQPKSTEVV